MKLLWVRSNNFYTAESRFPKKLLKHWYKICSQSFIIFQYYDFMMQALLGTRTSETICSQPFLRCRDIEYEGKDMSLVFAAVPAVYPSDITIGENCKVKFSPNFQTINTVFGNVCTLCRYRARVGLTPVN